jgi:hypothetical protein
MIRKGAYKRVRPEDKKERCKEGRKKRMRS